MQTRNEGAAEVAESLDWPSDGRPFLSGWEALWRVAAFTAIGTVEAGRVDDADPVESFPDGHFRIPVQESVDGVAAECRRHAGERRSAHGEPGLERPHRQPQLARHGRDTGTWVGKIGSDHPARRRIGGARDGICPGDVVMGQNELHDRRNGGSSVGDLVIAPALLPARRLKKEMPQRMGKLMVARPKGQVVGGHGRSRHPEDEKSMARWCERTAAENWRALSTNRRSDRARPATVDPWEKFIIPRTTKLR